MAIDLALPEKIELVNIRFKIPSDVAAEFDLYVKAAQEGTDGEVDQNVVLQAVLAKTMKKDRSFRAWLKNHRKNGNGAGKSSAGSAGSESGPGKGPTSITA